MMEKKVMHKAIKAILGGTLGATVGFITLPLYIVGDVEEKSNDISN